MPSSKKRNSFANNSFQIPPVADHSEGQPFKQQFLRPIVLALSPVEDDQNHKEAGSKQIFSTNNYTPKNNYTMNSPTSSTSSSSDYSSRSTRTPFSEPDIHLSSANQENELPKKDPISSGSSSSSSKEDEWSESGTSGVLIRRKPDARLRVRTLCLLGALLPGIGCYICIAYTYLFQADKVMNFTSNDCPNVQSSLPPVSYSIGVWKPQKYFWLLVLALHLPPRMFYGLVYKNQFKLGESEYKQRSWFGTMVQVHMRLMWVEAAGLVTVSIIDIDTYFVIHACCYSVWVISFCFNMLFNTLLHHHSGIRQLTLNHDRIFYIKSGLFLVGYPLAVSTGFSYFSFLLLCSGTAYVLFSVAEYILVGLNSLFYFLLVWELTGSRVEFYLTHKPGRGHIGSTRTDVAI